MLVAKSAAPIGACWPNERPLYVRLIERPVTLIQAPPGYFLADKLAQTYLDQAAITLSSLLLRR
jgi:hypothetical protein